MLYGIVFKTAGVHLSNKIANKIMRPVLKLPHFLLFVSLLERKNV